ncbi:hypothetical protein SK128_014079 [Halocaridina rubra]|uniref:Endonuclease/exonuclease/phosphatase domain-containing protein n=1 Tax=Halocaridina rubra TaxID=373956 RepID=A0AAN8ZWC8_HALRR
MDRNGMRLHPFLPPHLAPVSIRKMFDSEAQLHILTWNACGIMSSAKLAAIKMYVRCQNPNIIFFQEAFAGCLVGGSAAPPLCGYVFYVHHIRNGFVTYVHSYPHHQLLCTSVDVDATNQLVEVTLGGVTLRFCNVYSAPDRLNTVTLPLPTASGMVYMGDFNTRHSALAPPMTFSTDMSTDRTLNNRQDIILRRSIDAP